jgi:hypothetical protein
MTIEQATDFLQDVLLNPHAHGIDSCLLCRRDGKYTCVFPTVESFAKRIGTPKGKTRVIYYSLCDRCLTPENEEETFTRVEEELLKRMQVH